MSSEKDAKISQLETKIIEYQRLSTSIIKLTETLEICDYSKPGKNPVFCPSLDDLNKMTFSEL